MTPELNVGTLLNELFVDTVRVSLPLFRPELCLVATIGVAITLQNASFVEVC